MRVPAVRFVQGRNRYGTSTKYAIAVHATANTAPAVNEAAYATRRTDGTSAHFYIDATEVIQSLDTADRAGHAGSDEGNSYAIAFEITGANGWSRAKWLSSVAWDLLGAALAAVSRHHGIPATRATVAQMKANPRVRGAYDHNQMRLAWGGTDHTDPGPNFPWDKLLAVWQQALTGGDDMPTVEEIKQAVLGDPGMQAALARIEALASGRPTVPLTGQPNVLQQTLAAIMKASDVDAAEVARIAAAVPKPPTAEEVGDAVVDRLGAESPDSAAASLVAALGRDRAAALAAALTTATQG